MLNEGQELRRNVVEFLTLEDRIPQDHLLWEIDGAVDFMHLYDFVDISKLYSEDQGRPSIDPVVLFKIVLFQHLYGIPSLRRRGTERSWLTTPDTPQYRDLYARRKETIEEVFAGAKEKHGMRYTLYRGLAQVSK